MCAILPDIRFSALGTPRAVWAVSSVHGDAGRLMGLHDALMERIRPGDRVVYLGNYTGFGTQASETVDEILTFRRMVLSIPGVNAKDIVYLRGAQEDMWQRLTQLQFDRNPVDTLLWMMDNGLRATMENYGIDPHDGMTAAREGVMPLTRWTGAVRDALRRHAGHDTFMAQYRRAAYTSMDDRFPILFVNAGIDRTRTLEEQGDSFWWAGDDFFTMTDAYQPFEKVIRGFDPTHQGVRVNCVTASLDGGCGFGGSLVAAGISAGGDIFEILES